MSPINKPTIYVEQHDGRAYLRVEEQQYSLRNPENSVSNRSNSGGQGNTYFAGEAETYEYRNIDLSNTRYGFGLSNTQEVNIYDLTVDGIYRGDGHASVIGLGLRGPIDEPLTVQRVHADGGLEPMRFAGQNYGNGNKDFLDGGRSRSVSRGGDGYTYLRDVTARNFTDGIIDTKDTVYIMNATLENAHRILRVWNDSHVVLVNSEINLQNGESLIWLYDNSSRVSYYNTTWNGQPDPDPSLISVFQGNRNEVLRNVQRLDENPLPDESDFFDTSFDQITVEVSRNGGPWQEVEIPNTGENGVGPIGDLLYDLPNLGNGDYQLRTFFSNDGVRGPASDTLSYTVRNGRVDYDGVSMSAAPQSDDDADDDANEPAPAPAPAADPAPAPAPQAIAASTPANGDNAAASLGDGVTLSALGFDGEAAQLTRISGGFGVGGGRYNQQADFDGVTGRSEAFRLDFDGLVEDVTVNLQMLGVREYQGQNETGRWVAFDAQGAEVGSGVLTPSAGRSIGPTSRFAFDIDAGEPIAALEIRPTAYGDGAVQGKSGNNSDFQFYGVDYARAEEAPAAPAPVVEPAPAPEPNAVATPVFIAPVVADATVDPAALFASSAGRAEQVDLSDGASILGVGLDGAAAALVQSRGGWGVDGGRYDMQADFDAATGAAESFVINFGGAVDDVNLTLQMMVVDEFNGLSETGRWTAFDAQGGVVDEGVLAPENGVAAGASAARRFEIDAEAPFAWLQITPTAYGDGAGVQAFGNNSDFQFADVSFARAVAPAPAPAATTAPVGPV
ncbi:MAG: hypothetical protein AAGC56_07840, partial [Pseudomonadota bacterium]